MKYLRLVLLAVLVALAAPTVSHGQPPETGDSNEVEKGERSANESGTDDLFFETVEVNLVNVEVYVTDKKGEPIKGLTKDDFEILEDKRPVKITNFYVMEEGRPVVPKPAVDAPSPAVPGEAPPIDLIPEEQKLFLVIYVDNFNIRPFNRNRVFGRVREFLREKVEAVDQVMLVSYDRSLKIRHPFTNDPAIIARSLFELETLTGHAVHKDSDRRDLLRDIDEAENIDEVRYRVTQYAESLYNDLRFSLSSLKELVGSLGGVEGRKAVLYVSDGLEMIQGEDLFHAMQQKFNDGSALSRTQDFNASRDFTQLTTQANANRVSFYTVDAAGLRVSSTTSADFRGLTSPGLGTLVDTIHFSNLQAPLIFMAQRTGGRALYNTNDIGDGLTKIARDFDTYYSLGYNPGHVGDGRYHRIRVQLKEKRKGVRIRHRDGYRDKSRTTRIADATTSTLMYGFERNPLSIEVKVGQGTPGERGHFVMPIAIMVPLGKISLVPRDDFHQGRVKLYFTAMDGEGRTSDMQEVPIDIRIPNGEVDIARGKSYVYTVELQMRRGENRLAIAVRDEIGSTESLVSQFVLAGSAGS